MIFIVEFRDNVVFINDSKATNAEAAAKALSCYDRIFWIIGGRAKKGGLQGLEIFRDKIEKTYVIGEARNEFSIWLKKNDFEHSVFERLDEALELAYIEARDFEAPCVVLLSPACASWDQYTSFEARGNDFSKKVIELINRD